MRIAFESPRQAEVIRLIDELDAYQKPLYPPESRHGIDIDALSRVHAEGRGLTLRCGPRRKKWTKRGIDG
ncbi:hypothetical protein RA280_12220 [Cupriavidus sp. CV2]|uniref:hypothetical protein n=1 Tax=Cupriavidus ulmosensis TaxID=3065913 RepID=UPI00296AB0A1|nr:hypothetical protein [Cupriavidus sp. CV2]MDW3682494.1 hypothetical protein [Cupriavidus sp. CV2]